MLSFHSDLILASDVVYDPSVLPELVAVTEGLLKAGSKKANALFALTKRNADTFQLFIELIEKSQVEALTVPAPPPNLFPRDDSAEVLIYRLRIANS